MRSTAPPGLQREALEMGLGDRLAGAQALQAQRRHDRGVLVGAEVDHDVLAVLERVDVMEDEERVGVPVADVLAAVAVEHDEARAVLRAPAEVLDERAVAERELQRVDRVRVLGQDRVALGHGERVDVGRAADRELRDDAVVLDQAVGRAAHQVHAHRERLARRRRAGCARPPVTGGDLATPSVSSVSGSNATGSGVSVSATHLPMTLRDVDVRVVGEARVEQAGHALEGAAARVGGELAEGDAAARSAPSKAFERRKRLA